MDPITIGLWVTGGMLFFVVIGMRVAFAAALAGFVGLVWLRWNGFDYDPAALLEILGNQRQDRWTSAALEGFGACA